MKNIEKLKHLAKELKKFEVATVMISVEEEFYQGIIDDINKHYNSDYYLLIIGDSIYAPSFTTSWNGVMFTVKKILR